MKKFDPGEMKRRIAIEVNNPISDGQGGRRNNFTLLARVFAKHETKSARITDSTAHKETFTFARFTFRYTKKTASLIEMNTANFRIRFKERLYAPREVIDISPDREMYLQVDATGMGTRSVGKV